MKLSKSRSYKKKTYKRKSNAGKYPRKTKKTKRIKRIKRIKRTKRTRRSSIKKRKILPKKKILIGGSGHDPFSELLNVSLPARGPSGGHLDVSLPTPSLAPRRVVENVFARIPQLPLTENETNMVVSFKWLFDLFDLFDLLEGGEKELDKRRTDLEKAADVSSAEPGSRAEINATYVTEKRDAVTETLGWVDVFRLALLSSVKRHDISQYVTCFIESFKSYYLTLLSAITRECDEMKLEARFHTKATTGVSAEASVEVSAETSAETRREHKALVERIMAYEEKCRVYICKLIGMYIVSTYCNPDGVDDMERDWRATLSTLDATKEKQEKPKRFNRVIQRPFVYLSYELKSMGDQPELWSNALPYHTKLQLSKDGHVLGKGAQGLVYKVNQSVIDDLRRAVTAQPAPVVAGEGGRDVAFKVIPKSGNILGDRATRSEVKILKLLAEKREYGVSQDGFFPLFYGNYVSADSFYISMELVNGQTISEMLGLDKDTGEPGRAARLAREGTDSQFLFRQNIIHTAQLAVTLAYLHSLGIIYGDLKAENVMVEGDKLVLVDYGLSRHQSDSEFSEKKSAIPRRSMFGRGPISNRYTCCYDGVRGTLSYIAPEKIMEKNHGFASDWWAFGVLIHELITNGGRPWVSLAYPELAMAHDLDLLEGDARATLLQRVRRKNTFKSQFFQNLDEGKSATDQWHAMFDGMGRNGLNFTSKQQITDRTPLRDPNPRSRGQFYAEVKHYDLNAIVKLGTEPTPGQLYEAYVFFNGEQRIAPEYRNFIPFISALLTLDQGQRLCGVIKQNHVDWKFGGDIDDPLSEPEESVETDVGDLFPLSEGTSRSEFWAKIFSLNFDIPEISPPLNPDEPITETIIVTQPAELVGELNYEKYLITYADGDRSLMRSKTWSDFKEKYGREDRESDFDAHAPKSPRSAISFKASNRRVGFPARLHYFNELLNTELRTNKEDLLKFLKIKK